MIRFGYFYLQGKLTVYDVDVDSGLGYTAYVASLSEQPGIAFRAVRPETAVARLRAYLETGMNGPVLEKVTGLPARAAGGYRSSSARNGLARQAAGW